MNIATRIITIALLMACFIISKSQDTLYRVDKRVTLCKITKVDKKIIDFLPWEAQDGPEHEIVREKVAYLVYQGGRIVSISDASVKSTPVAAVPTPAPTTSAPVTAPTDNPTSTKAKKNSGNTAATNTNEPAVLTEPKAAETPKAAAPPCAACDPTSKFDVDATVQLCGFKSNKNAKYKGVVKNYFYVNDPDKKFLNSKQLICLGMDFAYVKDVNSDDADNSADIKLKDLSKLCNFMNEDPGLYFLSDKFGEGRKVKPQMDTLKHSWGNVDEKNWVTSDDYSIPAGRIPAIIRATDFGQQSNGLGAVFIVEKFAKQQKTVSGYWVIFDFADKKVLLIDHLVYSDVTPPIGAASWWVYWKNALTDAQVWHPFDIEKYCDLEKKGQFEKVCGN